MRYDRSPAGREAGQVRDEIMKINDRRRLELAFSLLFSLPGTPMMQYGDEIGMGDDLVLDERECARNADAMDERAPRGLLTSRSAF
jgi:glycosidase